MIKENFHVIGVMSGTSLDGLDICYVEFYFDENWHFIIHKAETFSYTNDWTKKLESVIELNPISLKKLDEEYTKFLAAQINIFISKNELVNIDAICSHGHTVNHQPEKKLTYQIGNLQELADLVKFNVVCDFRVQDVEFGGQGAPLVPIGDKLLFSNYNFCLNLGGFANISFDKSTDRIAYDICPVNIVLNHYTRQIGLEYDNKGKIAQGGEVHIQLLQDLNALKYYKSNYPKSLGIEWVKSEIFPLIDRYNLPVSTVLKTVVEHVAIQISNTINTKKNASVLITGGGVYNSFLIQRIKSLTDNVIMKPTKEIIEFKEALIFGLLGVLRLRGEVNCLRSVTGAKCDHSSGNIFIYK